MRYLVAVLLAIPALVFAQTTYYSDANGMPAGTAQTTQPFQSAPIAPMNAPVAPTFPVGPLFPTSPRGM